MPRLFTALELPDAAVQGLTLARGGIFGARWLSPSDYHVTLRFIGDVDARIAHEIDASLADIRRPELAVRFDRLSWFGAERPRAIVALVGPDPAMSELAAEHERRMRRLGLRPETRNFTPHVTLARLKGVSAAAVADYLTARGRLTVEPFIARRFVLMSAREGSGGGPYVVEAGYPLG